MTTLLPLPPLRSKYGRISMHQALQNDIHIFSILSLVMRRVRNHLGKVFLRAIDCFLQLFSTSSSILHSTLALSSISRLSMLLKMAFSSYVRLSATVSTLRLLVLTSSIFYCSAKESLLTRAISSFDSSFFLFFFFLFFFFFFLAD